MSAGAIPFVGYDADGMAVYAEPEAPRHAIPARPDADTALTTEARILGLGLARRLAAPETAERDTQRMEDALRSIYGALRSSPDPFMKMVARLAAHGLGDDVMRSIEGRAPSAPPSPRGCPVARDVGISDTNPDGPHPGKHWLDIALVDGRHISAILLPEQLARLVRQAEGCR